MNMPIFLFLILFSTSAIADNSYTQENARWSKSLKESHPQKYKKTKEVAVDRHVLSKKDYENDPSILIAGVKTVIVYPEIAEPENVPDVNVKIKSQICDETSCGEWSE